MNCCCFVIRMHLLCYLPCSHYICVKTNRLLLRPVLLISTLFILGFNQVGYYFIVQSVQENIKEEMKAGIAAGVDEVALTQIDYAAAKDNISWEEDEASEFSYKGKMYDLVRTTVVNGRTILHCISDEKETELVNKYQAAMKDHDSGGKKQKKADDQHAPLFVYEEQPVKKIGQEAILAIPVPGNNDLSLGVSNHNAPPPKA